MDDAEKRAVIKLVIAGPMAMDMFEHTLTEDEAWVRQQIDKANTERMTEIKRSIVLKWSEMGFDNVVVVPGEKRGWGPEGILDDL